MRIDPYTDLLFAAWYRSAHRGYLHFTCIVYVTAQVHKQKTGGAALGLNSRSGEGETENQVESGLSG